jgi:hypothetical protein
MSGSVPSSVDDTKSGRDIPLVTKRRGMSGHLEEGNTPEQDIIFEKESLSPHEDKSLSLPTPVTATFSVLPHKSQLSSPKSSHKLGNFLNISIGEVKLKPTATLLIPIWVILSWSVIIYNNYIWHTLKFKFPIFLISWQLIFTSIGTRVLARTTRLLDGTKTTGWTGDLGVNWILPITALYGVGSIYTNLAYTEFPSGYIHAFQVRRA